MGSFGIRPFSIEASILNGGSGSITLREHVDESYQGVQHVNNVGRKTEKIYVDASLSSSRYGASSSVQPLAVQTLLAIRY